MRRQSRFICNKDQGPRPSIMSGIVCNLLPKLVRHDTMEGRNFIVVPMVILTEGVHNGSGGPLLYNAEELGKTPEAWNYKPVVVYHPELNGQGISACSPEIISTRKIGVMMNTRWEAGKLKSEAWLETEKADAVDARIMLAVNAGEMMELSTGVWVDTEAAEGEWKGEKYVGIARNFRPDHLAVLPDQIGACSIKDGAGFLRNMDGSKKEEVRKTLLKALASAGIVSNELSFSNIRESLASELRKRFRPTANPDGPFIYVEDVYSNFVIYDNAGKLFRLGYMQTETGVELSKENPAEVVRITEYRTLTGTFVGNQTKPPMNKTTLVDNIIKNGGAWSESDRAALLALNESQLNAILNSKPSQASGSPSPEQAKGPAVASAAGTVEAPPPVANTTPQGASATPSTPSTPAPTANKVITIDDYIAAAPSEMKDVLRNSLTLHNEEKVKLIGTITANKQNVFTKEDLMARNLGELRALAKLAGGVQEATTPNYAGMGMTANATPAGEEAMDVPVLNFAVVK